MTIMPATRRADDRRELLPRIVGLAAGTVTAVRATGPSLMPRSRLDTALVAAGSFLLAGAAAWGTTAAAQWAVRGLHGEGWMDDQSRRTAIRVGVGTAVAGASLIALRRWGTSAVAKAAPEAAAVTGVAPGSLDAAGRRFVEGVTPGLDQDPIRIFGSLGSGRTIQDRVAAVLAELDSTGAWNREHLVVASPTGSGFVEPVLLESVERMTRGSVATMTVQSNNLPSALSVPKIPAAASSHRALLEAVASERQLRFPGGGGPKLHVVGVSHGAWSSSDVLVSDPAAARAALGVDSGLYVGMPGLAKWDKVGTPSRVANITTFSNSDDPVNRFSLSLLWKRPDWLGRDVAARPAGISHAQRFTPISTFVQTAVDLKNATAAAPPTGAFVRRGHEYRAQIPTLVREALDLPAVDDATFAAIEDAIRASNVVRAA